MCVLACCSRAKMQYGKDVYEKVATAESAQQRPLLVA